MLSKYKPLARVATFLSLFLFIYTPPIFVFNVIHLIALVAYALLATKYRKEFFYFISSKSVLLSLFFGFFSIFILFFTILFTTQEFIGIYGVIIIFIEVLPISIMFALILKSNKYTIIQILTLIVRIGLFQSAIAIMMFTNDVFKDFIIRNFYSHFLDSDSLLYWVRFRVFGFSQSMLFGYPVVQATIASISLYLGLRYKFKYLLYVPLILFSVVINGRVGLIIFVLLAVIISLFNIRLKSLRLVSRFMLSLIVLFILSFSAVKMIENISPPLYLWLNEGYSDIMNLLSGDTTGYFKALEDMTFLPPLSTFLVGSGKDNYNLAIGSNSDVGYVNDLFLGGIFFISLLYISVISLIYSGVNKNSLVKTFSIVSFLIILLANIKGYSFRHNEFLSLLIFLSVTIKIYIKNDDTLEVRNDNNGKHKLYHI